MNKSRRGASYIPAFLATIVFLLPFERIPSLHIWHGQVNVRLSQIVALGLMILTAGWLVKNFRRFLKTPYLWLTLFLGSYLVSTALALNRSLSIKTYIFTAFTIFAGMLFSFFVTPENLPKIEKALRISTWIVLTFGFFQYFGDLAGLSTKWTRLAPNYVKAVFGFPRIQSTALEPLFFASFLLIPFCVLSAQHLAGKYRHSTLLLLTTLTIFLTVSRGAIYGGVLAVIFLGAALAVNKHLSQESVLRYCSIIVVAILMVLLMTKLPENSKGLRSSNQAQQRTQALTSQALNFNSQPDRSRNRSLAFDAFKSKPILGIGPGGFDTYAKAHYAPYQAATKVAVNNETLEVLAEGGVVGAILLLAFFVQLFYLGYLALKKVSPELLPWVYGLMAYLIATAIQYQSFSTLYIMHIWVATGILLGAVQLTINYNKKAAK